MNEAEKITVVYIESRNPKQEIVDRCLACVPGAAVHLYTAADKTLLRCEKHLLPGSMLSVRNYDEFIYHYSKFIIDELPDRIATSHVLFVQNDGYPINPKSWTEEFLAYDYLGAPVRWVDWLHLVPSGISYGAYFVKDAWEVGNGGFSLRSVNLLRNCRNIMRKGIDRPDAYYDLWEDFLICKALRPRLGDMKFGEFDIAKRFSCEQYPQFRGERPFGFHAGGNAAVVVEHELSLI